MDKPDIIPVGLVASDIFPIVIRYFCRDMPIILLLEIACRRFHHDRGKNGIRTSIDPLCIIHESLALKFNLIVVDVICKGIQEINVIIYDPEQTVSFFVALQRIVRRKLIDIGTGIFRFINHRSDLFQIDWRRHRTIFFGQVLVQSRLDPVHRSKRAAHAVRPVEPDVAASPGNGEQVLCHFFGSEHQTLILLRQNFDLSIIGKKNVILTLIKTHLNGIVRETGHRLSGRLCQQHLVHYLIQSYFHSDGKSIFLSVFIK